ncbi:hypothetical protein FRB96_006401 [Tulasnella sp. 330]|nr:hypothetical protein FRB96_006401 [Tulasnella sp. 330]
MDYEDGVLIPTEARQRLFSRQALLIHPRLTTDAFSLYIKASCLLGRVKTFNGRFKYRYTDGEGINLGDDTANLGTLRDSKGHESMRGVTTMDPRETDEFKALDALVTTFLSSWPREFKDPLGFDTGPKLDPTLAMIALHDPHADLFSVDDPSAQKLLSAARAILHAMYKVCGTTFDLLYLDHDSSTAWFIAGATLIRFLVARKAQGEEAEVVRLTQELEAIKCMLGNLGERTGVGLRQIKLLDMVYRTEQSAFLDPSTAHDVHP